MDPENKQEKKEENTGNGNQPGEDNLGDANNEQTVELEEVGDGSAETCKVQTEDEVNFQQQRENLTWNAAERFLDEYAEEEDEIISSKEKELYARQALLKGWNQKILKNSKLMLVGMGQLGRELAKDMALIGVGEITIVDPQLIENKEQPQFLIPSFEGKKEKVQIIKENLKNFNKFMTVNTIPKKIEDITFDTIKEHELIVACLNNFKTRTYMLELCKKFDIPYLEGTCLGLEGFVQAWLPKDKDSDDQESMFFPAYCDYIDPSMGENNPATASILAGILGQETIKVAFKLQDGDIGSVQYPRYIHYDSAKGMLNPYPDKKDIMLLKNKRINLNDDLLKQSTVFIAGVGALGCEIAKDLALAGVGKLILVDLDTIETSNLSRQLLFRLEDLGKPKAEIGAKRVKEINPDVEVEYHFTKIQELPLEMYENCDVIIAALDNVQARFDLNVIARRVKRPMIEGGTVGFEGHVQVIIPEGVRNLEETACYRCVVPIPPPDQKLIAACTPKGIPQNREHCVLRAEFIFRKKMEREPDLEDKKDVILLTGASNKELEMLKEREKKEDHGGPFVLQDMENVLENKIPAIQTVSSVIASIESIESMKMACIQQSDEKLVGIDIMNPTYLNYNGIYGIFDHLPVLKREDCTVCGSKKGIEYLQIPITPETVIGDIFLSLEKIGTINSEQKFMVTNPETKSIIYHPSIPSFSDKQKSLASIGIKAGSEVLLTPFGVEKSDDGSEPTKYQLNLISVS